MCYHGNHSRNTHMDIKEKFSHSCPLKQKKHIFWRLIVPPSKQSHSIIHKFQNQNSSFRPGIYCILQISIWVNRVIFINNPLEPVINNYHFLTSNYGRNTVISLYLVTVWYILCFLFNGNSIQSKIFIWIYLF